MGEDAISDAYVCGFCTGEVEGHMSKSLIWFVSLLWFDPSDFGYTVAQKSVPMFGCFAKINAA